MADPAELRLHRLYDARMVVPDIHNADAADEIQVALTVDVPDFGALRPLQHQRMRRQHAARDILVPLHQQSRSAVCDLQHELSLPRGRSPHIATGTNAAAVMRDAAGHSCGPRRHPRCFLPPPQSSRLKNLSSG
jgi:hypothetical protein